MAEITSEQIHAMTLATRALAPVIRAYFSALVEHGFTNDQALELIQGFQRGLIDALSSKLAPPLTEPATRGK